MKNRLQISLLMASMTWATSAQCLEFLPESGHQRFQAYGLFIDNQTSLLLQNGGRAWGALGVSAPILGFGDAPSKSQIVVVSSVNTAFRLQDALAPETDDSRIALLYETELSPDWLASLGYNHVSGHVNDDTRDLGLMSLNVGVEMLPLRMIYQGSSYFRPGFTIAPVFGSDPNTRIFQADEFVEYYPFGHSSNPRRATPYLALGLEQFGKESFNFSTHFQLGAYFGNHLAPKHLTTMRVVLGGYAGPDPRLKYYYYRGTRAAFAYAGIMFDL